MFWLTFISGVSEWKITPTSLISTSYTAWKVPVFLVRFSSIWAEYGDLLYINLLIHSKFGKIRTRKTPTMDNFYEVTLSQRRRKSFELPLTRKAKIYFDILIYQVKATLDIDGFLPYKTVKFSKVVTIRRLYFYISILINDMGNSILFSKIKFYIFKWKCRDNLK